MAVSTWNQAILARAVLAPDQAKQLADKVIAWLADERIILDAPSNCEFDDSLCYPPGPDFFEGTSPGGPGAGSDLLRRFLPSRDERNIRLVLGRGPVFNGHGGGPFCTLSFLPAACAG